MYKALLHAHSGIRYLVLLLLIVVIVKSLLGLVGKKEYTKLDNGLGLSLFIATHVQLLFGIVLYFISPFVQFSGAAMKDATTRYWLVEHGTAMLIAIVLITLARTTSKKMSNDVAKHRRLFLFNLIALAIILFSIHLSGRGII